MQTIEQFEEDPSAQGRIGAWSFAWNLAKDRPAIGGGFDVFYIRDAYNRYAPENPTLAPHSILFQVMGEHGFVGLAFYAMIWLTAWSSAGRVRSLTRDRATLKWAHDLSGMLQAAMAGYLVAGLFLSVAYFDLVAVLVALAVALRTIVEAELRDETQGGLEELDIGPYSAAPDSSGRATAGRSTSDNSTMT
jgi:probable O-glycosylation ligase (exosortase A-associated)